MKMGENSELSNLKGRFRGRNQSVELAIGWLLAIDRKKGRRDLAHFWNWLIGLYSIKNSLKFELLTGTQISSLHCKDPFVLFTFDDVTIKFFLSE